MTAPPRLAVAVGTGGSETLARRLARELALPLLAPGENGQADLLLQLDGAGPCLQATGARAPGPVRCAFDDPAMRHRRRGGHNEAIGRALGLAKRPGSHVLDGTGGFGRDALVLADLGARVTVCERQPLLAALLATSLAACREGEDPWLGEVARRIGLIGADVRELPAATLNSVDALYLDPMFPVAGKRAASGKAMAVLQELLGDDEASAAALVDWALAQGVPRVVVKRPRRAPPLGCRPPSHALAGRAVRFDVYPAPVPSTGG